MERIPEPELMDDAAQAQAYAQADFADAHEGFVDEFQRAFPGRTPSRVLDLGCGAADVTIRFGRRYPNSRLVGVDGAAAMLRLGRAAVAAADMTDRVSLLQVCLPDAPPGGPWDTVISNSLLHHLHDPMVLWDMVRQQAAPDAAVFVMDLRRPASEAEAKRLVERYAAGEATLLKRDFFRSLLAAYTPEEIAGQLAAAGLSLAVRAHGDRHVIVSGRAP